MTTSPRGSARRRPTLNDVAQQAGVSVSQVSASINGSAGPSKRTREYILKVAEQMGYRPNQVASALARARSYRIGVVFALSHPFHADVVERMYPAAETMGYELVLSGYAASRPVVRCAEILVDSQCEALVLVGAGAVSADVPRVAQLTRTVAVGSAKAVTGVDVVRSAGETGARLAVEHLSSLGHSRIACVDGRDLSGAEYRRNGYLQAMTALGLDRQACVIPGGDSYASGYAVGELVQGASHTAYVAYNDECAIGLIDALQDGGLRVPQDISVVGYDNEPAAKLPRIRLTTLSQDAAGIADLAIRQAVRAIEEPQEPTQELVVAPQLVVRGTTAASKR